MECEQEVEVTLPNKVNSNVNFCDDDGQPETVGQHSSSFDTSLISEVENGELETNFMSSSVFPRKTEKKPRRTPRFCFTRSASSPAMVVGRCNKDALPRVEGEDEEIKGESGETKSEWNAERRHVSFDERVHVLTKCSVITMPLKNSTRITKNLQLSGEGRCGCARSCLKKHGELSERKNVSFSLNQMLQTAVLDHDLSEVEHLSQHCGVNFNKKLSNGLTLLHTSTIEGCFRMVQYILKQGGSVDVTDDQGWTPLHYAALHGNVPCALALLRAGADIKLRTKDYHTAIELASDDEMLLLLGRTINGGLNKGRMNQSKETYV